MINPKITRQMEKQPNLLLWHGVFLLMVLAAIFGIYKAVQAASGYSDNVEPAWPSILGVLYGFSGDYRTSLIACLVMQVAAAILVLVRPGPRPIDA